LDTLVKDLGYLEAEAEAAIDKPHKFTTKTTSTAIECIVLEISVTPVRGGKATVRKVDPDEFSVS
jgi:hypothetical protein